MKLPHQFGKYLLLKRIAVGGMAELFRAKASGEQGFEKLVAVKRLLPHLSEEEEQVSMFIKEARIAAMLTHANIVQVYDFGQAEDGFYIAMEYVHGKDLKALMQRLRERGEPMPLEFAVRIISNVAAGLEYAHSLSDYSGAALNLVHRDISPRNILVSFTGEVKIADFGIAKAQNDDSVTRVGVLKGKAAYMSPEQASGRTIDKRSDIFSLGVIFYELITGKRMFQGETVEVLEKVRTGNYEPPETAAQGIPSEIADVLKRMLVLDPGRRYRSAGQVLSDLEDYQTQISVRQNAKMLASFMHELFPEAVSPTPFLEKAAPARSAQPKHVPKHQPDRKQQAAPEPPPQQDEPVAYEDTVVLSADSPGLREAEQPPLQPERYEADAEPVISHREKYRGEPEEKQSSSLPTILICLVLLGGLVVGAWYYLSPRDLAAQARLALEAGNPEEAAQVFDGVSTPGTLTAEERSLWAQALAAMAAQVKTSNPQRAWRLLNEAGTLAPDEPQVHLEQAKLLTREGKYEKAMEKYRKTESLDPQNPDIYFNMGFLFAEKGNAREAEKMFLRTISLNPDYTDEAYFNLAVMQHQQDKLPSAVVSLERSLELNPNNARAAEYLKTVRAEQQRSAE